MRQVLARLLRLTPGLLALWGVVVISFFGGYAVARFNLPGATKISDSLEMAAALKARLGGEPPHYFHPAPGTQGRLLKSSSGSSLMAPGLTLVTGVGADRMLFAKLIDAQGSTVHRWEIDWFKMWPDPEHVPLAKRPRERPGMDIHGATLSPNGDLTFNFSDYGLMQVDFCGRVKWRSPHMTHHAVFQDEDGHFWTLDVMRREAADPRRPNIRPPFRDVSVLEVGADGRVLRRFNVFDLLQANDLQGFLYQTSTDDESTAVYGDSAHVNDVEVFPRRLTPGLFKPGDVMVSVRNANLIFVFDPATLKIKASVAGRFVRQHDPDFIDGWTISIFDNNNVGGSAKARSSRIIEYSFKTGDTHVVFQGEPDRPFFTSVMGNHQRLPNQNILAVESLGGRALEVNPAGQIVWEYYNRVGDGLVGEISDAQRIAPAVLSREAVDRMGRNCRVSSTAALRARPAERAPS